MANTLSSEVFFEIRASSPFRDERVGKKAFPGTFVENRDEKQIRSARFARCGEFVMKTAVSSASAPHAQIEAACNRLMLAGAAPSQAAVAGWRQIGMAAFPLP